MEKSTHQVEVVSVELQPHPNADSLSLVFIDGYQVVVRTQDWLDKSIGAYIKPDSLVNVNLPEFQFLSKNKEWERIRVKKLRGVISMGLLVPAPENSKLGDDVAEQLQVKHWEEQEELSLSSDNVKAPPGYWQKYDVDSARKYNKILEEGEPVYITEKLDGSNARYCFRDGQIFCGSRSFWKKETENDLWWYCFKKQPQLEKFCRDNQELSIYGECVGQIKGRKYGLQNPEFRAFDIAKLDWTFVDANEFLDLCDKYDIRTVPIFKTNTPFSYKECEKLSNGPSLFGNDIKQCREGVVIKPIHERYDNKIGRVILKIVGNDYLMS